MHCVLILGTKFTMSGPHYFTVRQCKVIGHAGTGDLSPLDVEDFCTGILDSGALLASLVVVEYPNACLVDNALFGVKKVVECFGLK